MAKRSIESIPITAGHVALDFINTCDFRGSDKYVEYFRIYSDVSVWANRTGLFSDKDILAIFQYAQAKPEKAQKTLEEVKNIRETLHQIFSHRLARTAPPKRFINKFNRYLSDSLPKVSLDGGEGKGLSFKYPGDVLKLLPHFMVFQSLALLTSQDAELINICERTGCGWFFLDRSRRKNRRWCSMAECGNVLKQRRYRKAQH